MPASSGKITRHRLSRGGDRAANNALHRIALVRMVSTTHPHAPTSSANSPRNGPKKRILRLLKRAIAREMFTHLTAPCPIDDHIELRPGQRTPASFPTAIRVLTDGLRLPRPNSRVSPTTEAEKSSSDVRVPCMHLNLRL